MEDLFDIPRDGYHRVSAYVKRSEKATTGPWLPTLIQIPRDGCVYEPCQIEIPDEWEVVNNGFGHLIFLRKGDETKNFHTAYGVVENKIGTVIRKQEPALAGGKHWGGK